MNDYENQFKEVFNVGNISKRVEEYSIRNLPKTYKKHAKKNWDHTQGQERLYWLLNSKLE